MLKRLLLSTLTLVACTSFHCFLAQGTLGFNETPSYDQLIQTYKMLDEKHPEIELYAMGSSDTDQPIYLCIINGTGDSTMTFKKCREGTTILINNAIHPGEPDGVNASLIWIEEWIKSGKKMKTLPCIAFIPAYNVGGMLRRGSFSRANQDGPEAYGFRGNTQNLDLNRDFIKMDSPNAKTFALIYHALDPDVFVDTHVSNGADYQYTLTYISPLKERMSPVQANLLYDKFIPDLTSSLEKKKWDLFPYVDLKGETPKEGLVAFNDLPRYAMGYASLFHSLSFTVETHMLKPFPQRVQATKDFLGVLIDWTSDHSSEIETSRFKARNDAINRNYFNYGYKLSEKKDSIRFRGFEESYPVSEVTGFPRLKYDRNRHYHRYIPWYHTYQSQDSVRIPEFIVIAPSAGKVINYLETNGIAFSKILKDSLVYVSNPRVLSFKSIEKPWEGHFYHREVFTESQSGEKLLSTGSLVIPTRQTGIDFLLSVFIPEAEDSYFRWNFFDSHLQQKEHFSAYVFEDKAAELLRMDTQLAEEFRKKKERDEQFRQSPSEQLYFIYKNSPYYEQTDHCLPIHFIYRTK